MEAYYKPVVYSNWMAATTGKKEWSEEHEKALGAYFANFSDRDSFQQVVSFRENKQLDFLQRRQLDDFYNKMVRNQLPQHALTQTLELEKEISMTFNTFRPTLAGKQVTNNDLLDILRNSRDNTERKAAWLASKQVGKEIEGKLLSLVRKRNSDARALGYDNFYQMSFATQELELHTVYKIFEELKNQSDHVFREVKNEIDEELSNKVGVKREELRPWHYVDPFFQEAPPVSGVNLDAFFQGKDLEQVAVNTFQAMGLEIEDILKRSDLYPRAQKNPFGFCTNINRQGDIRILVNMDQSLFWSTALLHELGHAAYYKYIDQNLPFVLRCHSHTLTTEAIALLFGRMNKLLSWQKRFLDMDTEQLKNTSSSIERMLERQMLVSARWIMTFSFFERELYENPDQDLNQRWWEIVQAIQFVNPPEDTSHPDWAAKMHFSLAPVSY
nr:M2 family metallopeptidase [Caldalkalibacillus mannanilyticus]